MANKRVTKPDPRVDSLPVLCGLFIVFIALGGLRSMGWSLTSTVGEGASSVVALVAYALLLALCAYFTWAVQVPERATYLLGGSAALGVFPAIPKLPFLQDVSHAMLVLFLVANWRSLRLWREIRTLVGVDPRLASYLTFLLLAIVSVAVNFLQRGDVWQLKVGLSGLSLLGILFMALGVMVVSPAPNVFNHLRRGFLDSAQIAAAFGCVALVLLVVTPYSTGLTGDGQDTLWGFGYFDRLKLMFDGPGVAASYFVCAMSFAVHALSEHGNAVKGWARVRLLFLVQVSPWIIVATGSRVGKIALVVLVLTGLSWKSVRKVVLVAVPTTFAALLIALDFQSFPSAVRFFLSHIFPDQFDIQLLEKFRLHERFFDLEQRGDHWRDALHAIQEDSWKNNLFGMGYGVSGYRTSPYPTAHNLFLDMIIEIGFVGFAAYAIFCLTCGWLVLNIRILSNYEKTKQWAFFVCLTSIFGLAIAYPVSTMGLVLVLLLLIFSSPGTSDYKSRI